MKAQHDIDTIVAFQRALRAIRNAKRTASASGRLGLVECAWCGTHMSYAVLHDTDTIAAPVSHGCCSSCVEDQRKLIAAM